MNTSLGCLQAGCSFMIPPKIAGEKMFRFGMVVLLLFQLAGCVTSGGSFCDVARPIPLDTLAGKTTAEKSAILSHNEKGEQLCGWEPIN
jgi:hypothetical protein